MTLVYTYDGSTLGYGIPPTKISMPQRAELGSISVGGVSPEDPAASLALVGHRPFHIEETDCSQPRLFTGWVTTRNVGRSLEQGQFVGAAARIHDTTIVDLNACFGFRIITGADGNRPAESLSARVAWILSSTYLAGLVDDTGKVHDFGASDPMDATDYRGQYPDAVLSDCNDRTGNVLNYYAFWDPAPATGVARPGLFFDRVDETISTPCAISISNVLADIDGAAVFAPETEARLERTPEEVYSDVIVDYANGSVFRTLASTETAHIKRGTSISRPHTGRASTARTQADNYLRTHANEVDRITATIHVPSTVVGLLWAGQRMDVKFSHLPGYTAWTSMRIVASIPRPVDDLADWYDVDLELVSPRVVATVSCPAFITTTSETHTSGTATVDPQPISVDFTPTEAGVLLAFLLGMDGDHPSAHDITNITGAYTTLVNVPACSKSTYAIGIRAVTAETGVSTAAATYRTGYGMGDTWFGGQVFLRMSSVTPVQSKTFCATGGGAFDTAPTPGNMILVFGFAESATATPGYPASGAPTTWQTLLHVNVSHGRSCDHIVAAHCVEAGETNLYGISKDGGYSTAFGVTIMEWALTGAVAPTTGGTIPPHPGETTVTITNPAVTDDSDHGYMVGVRWVNSATGQEFVLVDNTVGAAVWISTTMPPPPDMGWLGDLCLGFPEL